MTAKESFGEELHRRMLELLMDGNTYLGDDPPPVAVPTLTVHKASAYLPVSLQQMVDAGAMSEAEARAQGWTPPPPIPWRRRARWRWAAWREHAGRKVGGWIAGVDLTERDEDW